MSDNMPAANPSSLSSSTLASASSIHNTPITHQHVSVSSSTNTELLEDLAAGKISKTSPHMLTATTQTAGRGQHTRTWQSPPGNIYLSLYHPLSSRLSGLLSLVVGYHLTQLPIIQHINRQRKPLGLPLIGVKWANDVGFYDTSDATSQQHSQTIDATNSSFHKLAGILIEPVFTDSRITGVVIGVGINIEDAPRLTEINKEGMDYHAISLNQVIKQTQLTSTRQTADVQRHLETDSNLENNNNLKTDDNLKTGSSASNETLPRAQDLYTSVSAALLRAIAQFERFALDPYALPSFINEYGTVNVLANRQIYVTQTQHHQPNQKNQNQPNQKILQGVVEGINADGSLKLRSIDAAQASTTVDVYTGTIRLVKSHES